MNIIKLARACALIGFTAIASSVNASTVTLSGPTSVAPGDTFDLTMIGDFDPTGMAAGGLNLIWDPAVFSFNGFTHDLAVDPAFSCPGSANCAPDTADTTLVGFGNFNGLIAAGAGATSMGTASFTAIGTGIGSFSMVDNPSFFGNWFDATLTNPIPTPSFTGTSVSVSAIPVPAAVWLFGSGLLGLVGVARRRKAA